MRMHACAAGRPVVFSPARAQAASLFEMLGCHVTFNDKTPRVAIATDNCTPNYKQQLHLIGQSIYNNNIFMYMSEDWATYGVHPLSNVTVSHTVMPTP